ncbi:MAG: RraA family protein [bacterium]|jgi:regulator of RNase E activity RraA|nr:RraA family protein [bacterium]
MAVDLQDLVEGFRGVSTASVSDAVDRVSGRPGFMTHEIKPILSAKLVGPAVTVLERAALEPQPPTHALETIDTAPAGAVVVIGMEDPHGSRNVACWGGLMATAAVTRRLAGAVLDAGVRDVEEIRQMGFPVFSRTVIPSTTVGRYVTVGRDLPVTCGGVLVHPGDIIVGDTDGVVVVPRAHAAEVLKMATEIEDTERRMAEGIRRTGSILKALDEFARI